MGWMTLFERIAGRERRDDAEEHFARTGASNRFERYIADIPRDRYRRGADTMQG